MAFTIRKLFTFDAAHRLPGHPKCGRLHGHTYKVEVVLRASFLDSMGFVRDFGDLKPIKQFIDDELDHHYLVSRQQADDRDIYYAAALLDANRVHDVTVLEIPTTSAENLAAYIFDRFIHQYPQLVEVRVWETPNNEAVFNLD